MPSSTSYKFGDIVLVPFPFTDQTQSKRRPAIVVSSDAYERARQDLILISLTTRVSPEARFGVAPLQQWKQAGLPVACFIKPVLFTFEKRLVIKRLGRLQEEDRSRVRAALDQILGA